MIGLGFNLQARDIGRDIPEKRQRAKLGFGRALGLEAGQRTARGQRRADQAGGDEFGIE